MDSTKFALIGRNLSHSFSKPFFERKFHQENILSSYDNLEFKSEEELILAFPKIKKDYTGCNVTIPYKKALLSLMDNLDPHVKAIGAMNVIHFKEGKSYGYNTDFIGFYDTLDKLGFKSGRRALMIGHGGAAAAVCYVLDHVLKIPYDIIDRSGNYLDWHTLIYMDLSRYDLIVNTTPIGSYPNLEEGLDLNYDSLQVGVVCIDLVYNPPKTHFLTAAEKKGAQIMNGLNMLESQAMAAWHIWTEKSPALVR